MLNISKRMGFSLALVALISGSLYVGILYGWPSNGPKLPKPHIIVIIADDLGWNDVSFHGADQIPTPNIDALAYNGVILRRHYVLPTCTPSRTAFLTGRYPIRTGMQGTPLSAGEPRAIPLNNTLLPEYLRQLGYATHLVGKWHVGYYTNRCNPAHRGFDNFFGSYNGYLQYYNHTICYDGHTGYDLHYDTAERFSVVYNYQYMTDLISEKAEDIISSHDRTKPLYLQLSHVAPHSSDAIDSMEVRDMKEVNATLGYIEDINRRKFGGMVTVLDESIGRVISKLKEKNMLENSIVVFISDNGAPTEGFLENFGSNYPLRGLKFTLFEGGIRGTACVYSPLIQKPSRISDQLFHITDWLPTFYSAAGGNLEDLGDLDGVDQWSSIKSAEKTSREAILLNIDEVVNTSAALIGRYKLLKGATKQHAGYYGDTGQNESYPTYDTSTVLDSPTAAAINYIEKSTLTTKKIMQLRLEAKVVCKNFTDFANCTDQCLFDIYRDPCETTDLSSQHPEIVRELNMFIQKYRTVLMNQTNTHVDPASYPEHFNGTWMPWLKNERV